MGKTVASITVGTRAGTAAVTAAGMPMKVMGVVIVRTNSLKILRHAQHQLSLPIHLLILPCAWRKGHATSVLKAEPALGPLAAALTVAVTLEFLRMHHAFK